MRHGVLVLFCTQEVEDNMTKQQNIDDPNSCWNKARLDEEMFIVLGRDVAGPATVRFWCHERLRVGKNSYTDEQIIQIIEARCCAARMQGGSTYDAVVDFARELHRREENRRFSQFGGVTIGWDNLTAEERILWINTAADAQNILSMVHTIGERSIARTSSGGA